MEASEELTVQAGYAAWAASYDDDGNPLIAVEGPAVRAWFGPVEGCLALDLGCGTGRHARALAEAGARVIALDLTPEMLGKARESLRHTTAVLVRHVLPGPLPFRDATFDLAVLGLVAEHIAALGPALVEVARVLRPGGRCVLSALHPDRTGEGQRARFIDPLTGLRRPIRTYHRTAADYCRAAAGAGLVLEAERSLAVSPELAGRLPRAAPYLGKNLGWVACWAKPLSNPCPGAPTR